VPDILQPGAGIIFMKVGTHAQEKLDDIIARKRQEIDKAGFALWGYGGSTCHPQSMVQPFAKSFQKQGRAIYLCMKEMESRHFAEPLRAEQSSPDGIEWSDIPEGVNVLGSRYALVIKSLQSETLALPLHRTTVAVGPSRGKEGHRYIAGQVDKACLEIGPATATGIDEETTPISLVAELAEPFAVFLRNRPGSSR
jgi:hypothetical protein